MTDWSKHVHRFAKKHNMSYKQANRSRKCKETYKKRRTSPRRKRMNGSGLWEGSRRSPGEEKLTKYHTKYRGEYLELFTDKELEENIRSSKSEIVFLEKKLDDLYLDLDYLETGIPTEFKAHMIIDSRLAKPGHTQESEIYRINIKISDTIRNISESRNNLVAYENEKKRRSQSKGMQNEKIYRNIRDTYETYAGRASHYDSSQRDLQRELERRERMLSLDVDELGDYSDEEDIERQKQQILESKEDVDSVKRDLAKFKSYHGY